MWYFADEIGPHIKSLTTAASKGCKENHCLTVKILETLCDGGLIGLCSLKTSALKYPYEKKKRSVCCCNLCLDIFQTRVLQCAETGNYTGYKDFSIA